MPLFSLGGRLSARTDLLKECGMLFVNWFRNEQAVSGAGRRGGRGGATLSGSCLTDDLRGNRGLLRRPRGRER